VLESPEPSTSGSQYQMGLRRENSYISIVRLSDQNLSMALCGSARNSYLRMLDPIQNQPLRTCLGAFQTSPVTKAYIRRSE